MVGAAVLTAAAEPGVPVLMALALTFGLVDALYDPAAGTVPPLLLRPDELPRGPGAGPARLSSRPHARCAVGCAARRSRRGRPGLRGRRGHLRRRAGRGAGRPAAAGRGTAERAGRRSLLREVVAGLRYAGRHEVVRPLLLLVTALNALGGPVTSVGVLLRVREEDWGIGGLAAFQVAFSAAADRRDPRGRQEGRGQPAGDRRHLVGGAAGRRHRGDRAGADAARDAGGRRRGGADGRPGVGVPARPDPDDGGDAVPRPGDEPGRVLRGRRWPRWRWPCSARWPRSCRCPCSPPPAAC